MEFDYEKDTRRHYQSHKVAKRYHAAFSQKKGWKSARFRAVASMEQAIVTRFLKQIPHGMVLDIPSGTGKLATVFQALQANVTACDISEEMLRIAREEYRKIAYENVVFHLCDAEKICDRAIEAFDVTVCLRLLHRVPEKKVEMILADLARVADYSIISFGIENVYHKIRRHVRMAVLGGSAERLCYQSMSAVCETLQHYFEILEYAWILPGLSQEVIFLLRSKIKTRNLCNGDS